MVVEVPVYGCCGGGIRGGEDGGLDLSKGSVSKRSAT